MPATFSFALGTASSPWLTDYSFGGIIAGGVLLVTAAAVAWRRQKLLRAFVLVQGAFFAGGMTTGIADRDAHTGAHLESLIAGDAFPLNEPVLFEGRICQEGPERGDEIEVVVDMEGYRRKDGWAACRGKAILRVSTSESSEPGLLQDTLRQGARLRSWVVWRKPSNFENPGSFDSIGFLRRRGIYLTGRTKSPRLIESVSKGSPGIFPVVSRLARARVREALYPLRVGAEPQSEAILRGLLTGDRSALDRETEEIFQNAGSFHILVVSGLHVAWMAGAWLFLLKAISVPDRLRLISAAAVILLYAGVAGFQPSITRCLWMFLLYLAGWILVRRTDPVNILFSAALLLLAADPGRLFEPGYQLSFLSVSAIVMTAIPFIDTRLKPLLQPVIQAGRPERVFLDRGKESGLGRKWRIRCELLAEQAGDTFPPLKQGFLCLIFRFTAAAVFAAASLVVLSVSVQVWIAPLLAYHFNRISWIAPLSNIIAVPAGSVSLASGILAAIAGHIPLFGSALVQFAGISSSFLLRSAEWVTRIPFAWQRCPTPPGILVSCGLLLLIFFNLSKWKRSRIPKIYNIVLLVILGFGGSRFAASIPRVAPPGFSAEGNNGGPETTSLLSLTVLDVGEGDSIVIRFPDGQLWILDAGGVRSTDFGEESKNGLDLGEAVVSRYLWRNWGNVPDRLWLSHTDIDHAGGAIALLNNFRIRRLHYASSEPDGLLNKIVDTAVKRGTVAHPVAEGTVEKAGAARVRVLHPPALPPRPSANDNSAVLHVAFNRFSVILTGDLEKKGEAELLRHVGNLESSLLKVAHHGSASGTSSAFLDAVKPRWAVISAGRHNPFGHPAPAVLSRLSDHGVRVYQTAAQGAVTFLTDGVRYEIRSHLHGVLERGELD